MVFGKSPPRFVPTLTEVVRPFEAKAPGPAALPELVAPASAPPPASLPPGFAELLQGWPAGLGLSAARPSSPEQLTAQSAEIGAARTSSAPGPTQVSAELQQVMVDRILQIVEDSVAQRVRQALDLVLAPQLQSLAVAVRAEVAEAVRQAVSDTLASEVKHPGDSSAI